IPGFSHVVRDARVAVTIDAKNFALRRQTPLSARAVVTLTDKLAVEGGVYKTHEIGTFSAEAPRSILEEPARYKWDEPLKARVKSEELSLSTLAELLAGVPDIDGVATLDARLEGS